MAETIKNKISKNEIRSTDFGPRQVTFLASSHTRTLMKSKLLYKNDVLFSAYYHEVMKSIEYSILPDYNILT